jgi:hypothetical protein
MGIRVVGVAGHRDIEVSTMQNAHNQLSADAPSGSDVSFEFY